MPPRFNSLIRKYEPFLFLLVLIFLLTENFFSEWLVTQDGPAHLYTSVVASDLLHNPASHFAPFFQLNPSPVPNSLDHILIMA